MIKYILSGQVVYLVSRNSAGTLKVRTSDGKIKNVPAHLCEEIDERTAVRTVIEATAPKPKK